MANQQEKTGYIALKEHQAVQEFTYSTEEEKKAYLSGFDDAMCINGYDYSVHDTAEEAEKSAHGDDFDNDEPSETDA